MRIRIELTNDEEMVLEYTLETIIKNLKKAGEQGSMFEGRIPLTDFEVVTIANLLLNIKNNNQ